MITMDLYNYYVWENADPRTHDWFLAGSPFPVLGVIVGYLSLVYYIVPKYMENREPYKMKTFLGFYNLFQVGYCVMVVVKCFQAGWTPDYFYRCYETDYSYSPKALKMAEVTWYILFIKFVELLETILFVLRKKQNQVSFLHVYHHISTFVIAYIFCKYVGGSMLVFSIVANSIVHIIMYSYYFISAYDVAMFKYVAGKIKRYITSMQLIQFALLTTNNLFGLQPGCMTCKPFLVMYIPNVFILIYLFSDFYKKSYDRKRSKIE
nr:elongation of very long chain fatty acids protein 7 [Aedes albopictus]